MPKAERQCPECQTGLKAVSLSDLIGERKAEGLGELLPAAGAIFNYYDFWVCWQCGRTLIYAGQEARLKAAEKDTKRIGETLGLK
jgi:hypothetical protein